MQYDLKKIHKLLNEGFNEQELRNFCFFEADFRPIHEQLRDEDRKAKILQLLLDHAHRKNLLDKVLAWAKVENPAKYNQYQPYTVAEVVKPAAKTEPGPDAQAGYHSCFISYAHQDEAFAEQLHADLQQAGVTCWFAPHDMKIGDKIRPTIDRSIHAHDKLLLILSQNSIDSDWVEKEVETAFERESQSKQLALFPIRLDETVLETDQAWAADIRRMRHIGNFSRWQDETAYQRALQRLLRDLKMD
jgi:hypothetical protein